MPRKSRLTSISLDGFWAANAEISRVARRSGEMGPGRSFNALIEGLSPRVVDLAWKTPQSARTKGVGSLSDPHSTMVIVT